MKNKIVFFTFFVFVTVSFGNNYCAYECDSRSEYEIKNCPNKGCKAHGANENAKTKVLYDSIEDAVCAAAYLGQKYGNGNRVYKCPKGYGYHLTTSQYKIKIKAGMIIDTDGRSL